MMNKEESNFNIQLKQTSIISLHHHMMQHKQFIILRTNTITIGIVLGNRRVYAIHEQIVMVILSEEMNRLHTGL